jgi:hypothetical protein
LTKWIDAEAKERAMRNTRGQEPGVINNLGKARPKLGKVSLGNANWGKEV